MLIAGNGMQFFKILRRDPVLFFKRAVKTRIVVKSEQQIHLRDRYIAEQRFTAPCQPLFGNVLVDRHADFILENVCNVIFAHKKFRWKAVVLQLFRCIIHNSFSIHTITNGMRKDCLWITFFIRLIHIIFTVLVLFYFRHFAQAT